MRNLKLLSLLLALIISFTLFGCSDNTEESSMESLSESSEEEIAEYPVTIGDVTLKSRPGKIISLSPALTEKLYDMELEEYLIGVSDYCDYPSEASELPKCGTAQLVNLDEIKSLKPHVLLTQAPLSEDDLIALQQADIDVVTIPLATSIAEFEQSYLSLATLIEGKYTGAELGNSFVANLEDRLSYLKSYLVPYAEENGVKNALYLRLMDFNVATGDTLENELMETIGLHNIAREQTGWLYPEELASGDGRKDFESVDIIFMDEKFVNIKMLEQSAYYKGLNSTLKDFYLYIDCVVFERQSLRMLDILESMAAYAYPDATPNN